jgi:hypothetical protein
MTMKVIEAESGHEVFRVVLAIFCCGVLIALKTADDSRTPRRWREILESRALPLQLAATVTKRVSLSEINEWFCTGNWGLFLHVIEFKWVMRIKMTLSEVLDFSRLITIFHFFSRLFHPIFQAQGFDFSRVTNLGGFNCNF